MDDKKLQQMMKTTRMHDNFQDMMKTTESFDEQYEHAKKQGEKALANAFAQMINMTQRLEYENEREIRRAHAEAKLKGKVIKRVPSRFRNLPAAFRRNPAVVIKYFLGMILGRILAIVLYIIAAFIPALPVPDSIAGSVGRLAGGAFGAMRSFVTDFNMATLVNIITNIPTDINKLIQKLGEAIQFYGRRAGAFLIRCVRHPRLAYEDLSAWARANTKMFVRLSRSIVAVACSFIMIKVAMILLLPLFGGIALTIMGFKISILLFVVMRMIFDKIGELIGVTLHRALVNLFRWIRIKFIDLHNFYRVVKQSVEYWK
ncbi:MAG: hypothetical protein IJU71_05770 [Selenomonadaceae bacterium]|nr:hypothetical protein [Selenomonadaceae bacterium]